MREAGVQGLTSKLVLLVIGAWIRETATEWKTRNKYAKHSKCNVDIHARPWRRVI